MGSQKPFEFAKVGDTHLTPTPTMPTFPLMATAVIRNTDFQLVTEFAQTDAKKRLSLGGALAGGAAFNIYRNTLGQLFLDPVKAIPASEAWLFESPQALASVKQGLKESAEGKRIYRGSFAKYAKE